MEINKYIKNCLKNSNFATQDELRIDRKSTLMANFINLRDLSENDGKECGFKLVVKQTGHLGAGPLIRGTETRLELDTKTWCKEATYIGDCHTHPYLRKMGDDAEIGPSSGDYKEWGTYPPNGYNIAVHFVISIRKVFLVFMRIKTIADRDSGKTESQTLNDYCNNNLELAIAANDDYPKLSYQAKLERRKDAWDRYAPNAAAEFARENMAYNLDMAKIRRFEFYVGDLGTNKDHSCRMTLRSSKLYSTAMALDLDDDEKGGKGEKEDEDESFGNL